MTRYVVRRLVLLPVLLFVFSVAVFAIIQAPPGDFLTAYAATLASSGSSINAEQLDALRREYGLDQPMSVQYLKWMGNLLRGNLGLSLEYQRPNAELIGERLMLTVALAVLSFVFTWIVAIPAGIYSATHQRSVLDYVLTVLNYVGVATPNFMLALILMWIAFSYFGIGVTGLFSPEFVEVPWSWARVANLLAHIWLPAVVLGVAGTARLTRVHHRLVPARALLRQPHRGDGDESAEHRAAAPARPREPGHVPRRQHSAHLLLPHDRRHPHLRHPPRLARSPHPHDRRLTVETRMKQPSRGQAARECGGGAAGAPRAPARQDGWEVVRDRAVGGCGGGAALAPPHFG